MSTINLDILNELTDNDIKIICNNADLDDMLQPIKYYGKRYAKYRPQLGRLDKKSALVQRNLPNFVYDLYKKGDINYVKFFAMQAAKLKDLFEEMLKEFMGDEAEPEQISTYAIEDFRKIFQGILDKPGLNLNMELFFLQIRMFGIEISDDMKWQIEKEWEHIQEVVSFKKEIQVKYDEELKQKEYEARAKMELQREEYNEKIKLLDKEIKELKADATSKQQAIVMLTNNEQKIRNELNEKQELIDEKSIEIEELKGKIVVMQLEIDDMTAKLHERRNEAFSRIQKTWQEENQKKVSEIKELDRKSVQLCEEIIELEEKKKQLEKTVANWEEHIESYFLNIDQKIIEHRIDSILYKKGYNNSVFSQDAATSEYAVNINDLYVQKGYKVEEKEECRDYEDYIEIVEVNLLNCGDKMPAGMMNDCFNSAINAGLCPLICGYRARELAMALIASRYAEKPEIISVLPGYGNTNELGAAINMAETTTVIVEDVFGRMNEGIILPILRDSRNKVVVFTAESVEDIAHLQLYYFNYIQLIVTDKHTTVQSNNYLYADTDELLAGSVYTGKEEGHKLSRKIFEYIGMNNSYVLTRGNVICELLAGKKNTEEESLFKILTAELKWLIKESEKEKLVELFESNENKYPRKLIECIG